MYIGMLVWPIRGLGRIIGDFGKAVVASNRIEEVLSLPDEYGDDGTETPEVTGAIEFKNGFPSRFPDSEVNLLEDVKSFKNKSKAKRLPSSGKPEAENQRLRICWSDSLNINREAF